MMLSVSSTAPGVDPHTRQLASLPEVGVHAAPCVASIMGARVSQAVCR